MIAFVPPKLSMSDYVGTIKGRTELIIRPPWSLYIVITNY
jgi:hypothetical protein